MQQNWTVLSLWFLSILTGVLPRSVVINFSNQYLQLPNDLGSALLYTALDSKASKCQLRYM